MLVTNDRARFDVLLRQRHHRASRWPTTACPNICGSRWVLPSRTIVSSRHGKLDSLPRNDRQLPSPSSPSTAHRVPAREPSAASSPPGSAGTCSIAERCTGWSRSAESSRGSTPTTSRSTWPWRAPCGWSSALSVPVKNGSCSTAGTSRRRFVTSRQGREPPAWRPGPPSGQP